MLLPSSVPPGLLPAGLTRWLLDHARLIPAMDRFEGTPSALRLQSSQRDRRRLLASSWCPGPGQAHTLPCLAFFPLGTICCTFTKRLRNELVQASTPVRPTKAT